MSNQLQITGDLKVKTLTGALTASAGVVSSVPLGAANGVATLGSDGKVPSAQLPTMGSSYKGTWNAATNTPTIADGVGTAGDYYLVSTGGTWNGIVFLAGNTVIYSGTVWQKAGGGSGTVTSVGLSAPAAFSVSGSPVTSTGTLTLTGAGAATDYIKGDGTLAVFGSSAISAVSGTYLALAGGIMTGQIVLKEASSISDYTKGLRFPNDPFGGSGDTSGLRLYAETTTGAEAQVLELYVTNDGAGVSQDRINLQVPSNDLATINGNKIWNAGNLTPQTQLNGTGFVKATGTTIIYDNTSYLPLGGGTLTGALNGTSATFSGDLTIDTNTLYVDSTNNRVGIGTTNPISLLSISKALSSDTTYLTLDNKTNTKYNWGINWAVNDSSTIPVAAIRAIYPADNDISLGFYTFNGAGNVSERMRISSDGNVGIGTNSPSNKLDVRNGGDFDVKFRSEAAGGTVGLLLETANSFSGTSQAFVKVIGSGANGTSQLIFGTAGASGDSTATERARITPTGSLLIGTQTDLGSGYKLQVNGSISMAYANFFNFKGSSGAGDVLVDNSGSSLRVTGAVQLSNAVTFNSTALVQGLLTNYNVYNTQTSSYTLVLSDASKIIEMNVGSANTVTIPTNASVAFPIGTEITVMQYGAGVTSIAVASGVTIVSKDSAYTIANRYTGLTLIKRATNEWYIIGNIVV